MLVRYYGNVIASDPPAGGERGDLLGEMKKYYCVYIITNSTNSVLYTGVTGNLLARMYQHKNKSVSSFSSKYNLNKLVYYEIFEDINLAIAREKQIKAGSRKNKLELIHKLNPDWRDLYSSLL
jgi:putative endonuclease